MNAKRFLSALILWSMSLSVPAQHFLGNIEEAAGIADSSGKQVLLVFSGSDWCKPCILLKRDILSQAEFEAFASEHLVMVNLDFPYHKKNQLPPDQQAYNEAAAERFNPDGRFPEVILLGADQQVLRHIPYRPGMEIRDFIAAIESGAGQ